MTTKETVAKELYAFLEGDPGLPKTRDAQGNLKLSERDARVRFAKRFTHPAVREWLEKAGLTFSDLAMIYPDASREHWVDICLGEWEKVTFSELHNE